MLFYIRKKILAKLFCCFNKGRVSDKSFEKLYGAEIFIYPFKRQNLYGASYNLSASCVAFIEQEGTKKLIIDEDGYINIPSKTVATIFTEESIYVSERIGGIYSSKVNIAKKGLQYMSSTLDPNFSGVSQIMLYNITTDVVKLNIGETIVTLTLDVINKKSTGSHNNQGANTNIDFSYDNFYVVQEKKEKTKIIKEIKKWQNLSYISNKIELIRLVENKVKKQETNKDILIYSILMIFLGIATIYMKKLNIFEWMEEIQVGDILTTVTLVVGIIVLYKTNKKYE